MSLLAPLTPETVEAWPQQLNEVAQRWQAVFPYRKTHARAMAYLEGLCSAAPRKNCWQLAAVQGAADPYGCQHLLGRAAWSAAGGAPVQRHGGPHRELPDRGLSGLCRAARGHAAGPGPLSAAQLDGRAGTPAGGGPGRGHALCHQAAAGAAAGVTAAWVVGDSVYGHSSQLRQWLESQGQAYVLAVPGNEHV